MRAVPALGLALLLLAALAGGSRQVVPQMRHLIEMPRGELTFHDFRLFNGTVLRRLEGGPLYEVEAPGFYEPGSAVYKYPPPYAALLSLQADRRWRVVATRFLLIDSLCILIAWAVLSLHAVRRERAFPPPRPHWWDPGGAWARSLGLLCIVVLWKPFFESLIGLQLEPLFLPLLALALVGLERGRGWMEGVAIGVSAAFKVYPAFLALGLLLARRGRTLLIAVIAGLAALALGAWRFSWEETRFYFADVLPRLGGTSLAMENLGALGQIGNLLVLGYEAPRIEAGSPLATLEGWGSPAEIWAARLITLALGVALTLVSAQAVRALPEGRRGPTRLALTIPILLVLVPTSWLDYQTLLFAPAAWLFLCMPVERDHLGAWILFVASTVPCLTMDTSRAEGAFGTPAWISAVRALAPIGIWGAIILAARVEAASSQRDQDLDDPLGIESTRATRRLGQVELDPLDSER